MDLPKIPLLSRVQPLPAAYGTHNVTNITAELLARIMACEIIPENTLAIIICDSTVVHSQKIALIGHNYTNRHHTRSVFPVISRMLAQRLEATSPQLPIGRSQQELSLSCTEDDTPIVMDTILTQIRRMHPCGKAWLPHKHLTLVHNTIYIKIKSHRIRSNGYPKYRTQLQPCMALVHINHCTDKTCDLPHLDTLRNSFLLRCTTTHILSPCNFIQ